MALGRKRVHPVLRGGSADGSATLLMGAGPRQARRSKGSLCCQPRSKDGLFSPRNLAAPCHGGHRAGPSLCDLTSLSSQRKNLQPALPGEVAALAGSQPADVLLFPTHRCDPELRLPSLQARLPLPAWGLTSEGPMPRLHGDHEHGVTCSAPELTAPPAHPRPPACLSSQGGAGARFT